MKPILAFALLLTLSVISCDKDCGPGQLQFSLIGFSDAEADTIILRRFIRNDATIFDTTLAGKNELEYSRSNDTLTMVSFSFKLLLESRYDYEVYFPGASKLFKLTGIVEDNSRRKGGGLSCTKEDCNNAITGATVNGQFTDIEAFRDLYLRR